jgi:DnaJ-class molecular chaperone
MMVKNVQFVKTMDIIDELIGLIFVNVFMERLKRQIADNKATCPICYNRGVKDKNSFCTCKHGEDYLHQIEEGSKVCELCKNKGVIIPTHFLCDPHDHMIYGDFCQCKHGKDAILLAKEDPKNCPICYGHTTGSYVDGLGFVVSWNTCPHVNARA